MAFAAINFSLVPAAPLAEQVRQCRAAVAWSREHAAEFGAGMTEKIDPTECPAAIKQASDLIVKLKTLSER